MKYAIILVVAFTLNAMANILVKMGMLRVEKSKGIILVMKQAILQPALISGVICFGLALAAYSVVLLRMNLSIAYPIMVSMGLIIVILASHFIFKETITLAQIAGFLLIMSGVWLVAK